MSATRVVESRVFKAPSSKTWAEIRPLTFTWDPKVTKCQVEGASGDCVGSLRVLTFKDGTVQKYKVLELSDMDHFITYEIIESNPPIPSLAAVHKLAVRKVTHENLSYVEWESDFSAGENIVAVVEDAKFKKIEAFEGLSKKLAKK